MPTPEPRPTLLEKRSYAPALPVEEFIVPRLKREIEAILAQLPERPEEYAVLDLGCGGQPFRGWFERKGHRYVSADAQDSRGIVDHVAEIDRELPAPLVAAGPFDFILCTEVLEHVADWDKAFLNFRRLLADGGTILLTCPHVYVLHEQPFDFWRPTLHALRFFATRHGFEPVKLEASGDSWDVLGTVLGASLGTLKPLTPGLFQRSAARALNLGLKVGYRVLKTRWLQARFKLGNERYPFYLSNVCVLRKIP